jgi:hypothetical protein
MYNKYVLNLLSVLKYPVTITTTVKIVKGKNRYEFLIRENLVSGTKDKPKNKKNKTHFQDSIFFGDLYHRYKTIARYNDNLKISNEILVIVDRIEYRLLPNIYSSAIVRMIKNQGK